MSAIAPDSTRRALVSSVLRVFPRSIQATLILDDAFAHQFGIVREPIVSIGNMGISLQQTKLTGATRELLSNNSSTVKVLDKANREWTLQLEVIDGQKQVSMQHGDQMFYIPTPLSISPNRDERLEWFDVEMRSVYLNESFIDEWRERISQNSLSDGDLAKFQEGLTTDPEEVFKQILAHLALGEIGWDALVPGQREYYETLVGKWTEGTDLTSYSKAEGAEHIRKLIARDPLEGLLRALLLTSHPNFVEAIRSIDLPADKFVQAIEWLAKQGDTVSCAGAVEVGLFLLKKFPEIAPKVEALSKRLCIDDGESPKSRWKLLGFLVSVVDGELARKATLEETPPFWRRLAAIAHASVIERALLASNGDAFEFAKLASDNREFYFTIRSYVDLRLEPRWLPDYVSPDQLRQEFLGRIMGAAEKIKSNVPEGALWHHLYGENDNSIVSAVTFPYAYFPGPLEGAVRSNAELPLELSNDIKSNLGSGALQASSFTSLINSSLVFRLPDELIQLAVEAIRLSKYRLTNLTDKQLAFSVLHGLGTVAASTRNPSLATEVRVLTRVRLREDRASLNCQDVVRIALVSAAAHSDLNGWCKFLGEWLTEIAYGTWSVKELSYLHSVVRQLLIFVPELWVTAAPADTAISAVTRQAS